LNLAKAWYVVALATLFASPELLIALLVVIGIVFAIFYVTLLIFGLVSAIIYGSVGVLLVVLAGKNNVEKHFWLLLFIPIFFVFGWISDRSKALGLSLTHYANIKIVISQNALINGLPSYVVIPVFALAAFVIALVILIIVFVKRIKKPRKH